MRLFRALFASVYKAPLTDTCTLKRGTEGHRSYRPRIPSVWVGITTMNCRPQEPVCLMEHVPNNCVSSCRVATILPTIMEVENGWTMMNMRSWRAIYACKIASFASKCTPHHMIVSRNVVSLQVDGSCSKTLIKYLREHDVPLSLEVKNSNVSQEISSGSQLSILF